MFRTNTDLEESILRIPGCFFLRSSERDPVFNGVARRSARFTRSPGGPFFFSTVLSRLFPRTDRLRNWVVKAERDMIVYQRRTGSSPCIWRLANLGAYCAIICCSSFSISMNSSPKLLSYALRPWTLHSCPCNASRLL